MGVRSGVDVNISRGTPVEDSTVDVNAVLFILAVPFYSLHVRSNIRTKGLREYSLQIVAGRRLSRESYDVSVNTFDSWDGSPLVAGRQAKSLLTMTTVQTKNS